MRSIRVALSRSMSVIASLRFGLWIFSTDRLSNRKIEISCKQTFFVPVGSITRMSREWQIKFRKEFNFPIEAIGSNPIDDKNLF